MKKSVRVVSVVVVMLGLVIGVPAGATVRRDGSPTKLVKLAKSLGIKEPGPHYTFEEEQRGGDLSLTVEVPAEWSERADSHFTNPDTNEPYGAGVRATTDAEAFANTYDVPGVKVTAGGLTSSQVDSFDAADLLANIRYPGCRKGKVKPFDNGVYKGKYQAFARCDGERTAAVAVDVLGRGFEILVVGVVHTKADLAAIDHALLTASVEKTSA